MVLLNLVVDQMEANGSPTNGLVELNHHQMQNGQNGVTGDRVCEEELRNSGVNKQHAESMQAQAIKQTLQQQPRVSLVLWERFLPLRSVKVLLVENDDSTQQLLKALLRNCSYEVTAVADGLHAWKVLQDINSRIDLVLTELSMPFLSGVGLLMKIKSHKTFKSIPVIMMSANDSTAMVYKCLSKGAADFLLKPIRKNELRNLWQHVWRKCHSSSCSGSESGIRIQKFTHSKSSDKLHSYNDCSDEDDTESVGLNARGGNDDISSTQNSWSKRDVEGGNLQPMSPSNKLVDAPYCNSDQDINSRPNELRVPAESTIKYSKHDNVLDNTAMGKYLELGLLTNPDSELQGRGEEVFGSTGDTEMDKFQVLDSIDESNTSRKEKVELRNGDSYPIDAPTDVPMHLTVSVPHDISTNLSKITDNQHTAYGTSEEMPCVELSLKRLRDTSHTGLDTLHPNRHREVSTFSRYNANTSSVNVGSHSPVNNSSEAAKIGCKQANTTSTLAKTLNHRRYNHHRRHYHHHHPYNLQRHQPLNNDDLSLENLNVVAANGRPSDKLGKEMEGNGNNYGSASGSNEHNGSCGHHGSDKKAIVKCGACEGNGRGSETEVDQYRLTQREASLNKFRQKRKERRFETKVRYDGRKRLAEQRPRVRGQFVRQMPENINQAENENREC